MKIYQAGTSHDWKCRGRAGSARQSCVLPSDSHALTRDSRPESVPNARKFHLCLSIMFFYEDFRYCFLPFSHVDLGFTTRVCTQCANFRTFLLIMMGLHLSSSLSISLFVSHPCRFSCVDQFPPCHLHLTIKLPLTGFNCCQLVASLSLSLFGSHHFTSFTC